MRIYQAIRLFLILIFDVIVFVGSSQYSVVTQVFMYLLLMHIDKVFYRIHIIIMQHNAEIFFALV